MNIKKRRVRARKLAAAVAAAPAVLTLSAPGLLAQDVAKPWSVKAGVNWLSSGEGRDGAGSTGYSIGAGYTLPSPSLLSPRSGRASVDVGYSRNSDSGNHLEAWSVQYVERIPVSRSSSKSVPYVGIGVGLYRLDGRVTTLSSGGSIPTGSGLEAAAISPGTPGSVTEDDSRTTLGASFIVGTNIGESAFVEASYNLTGKVAGVRADSVNLSVGIRF